MIRPCKNCKAKEAAPEHSLCYKCGYASKKAARKYYWADPDRGKAQQKASREKIKDEVFDAYGGAFCKCCGYTRRECLQVDHINGGGSAHLRSIEGQNIYRWLKKNKFPTGFQILCANCNWIKRYHGMCNCMERRKIQ